MRVRIQVVIESDDGQIQDVQDVFQLRRGELKPERESMKNWGLV